MDKKETTHIRIRKSTLKKLRLLHAYLDKSIIDIIDELVSGELKNYER